MHASYNRPAHPSESRKKQDRTRSQQIQERPFLGMAKRSRPWTDSESRVIGRSLSKSERLSRVWELGLDTHKSRALLAQVLHTIASTGCHEPAASIEFAPYHGVISLVANLHPHAASFSSVILRCDRDTLHGTAEPVKLSVLSVELELALPRTSRRISRTSWS